VAPSRYPMVLKRRPRKGFESAFEDTALKPAPNQPLLEGLI